jgi:uncharacterized membrane protein YphA (DoxX/SURF4 family)
VPMLMRLPARDLPARLATGVYIAHSGWEKWKGRQAEDAGERAERLHGMAAGAYPFLSRLSPRQFITALAVGELAVGTALCLPAVPNRLAGAALTAFAGGLVGMYLRTPSLHRPGSFWPTPAGTAISKDVWMLGIGLSLLAGG